MRKQSAKYRTLANHLIRTRDDLQYIKDFKIKIAYLECNEEKKKNRRIILADCTKVSPLYEWCCKYDFFITVYTPNIELLSDEQMRILMLHELYHVGVDNDGEEPKFYCRPHDIEEFDAIIKEFGLHWEETG